MRYRKREIDLPSEVDLEFRRIAGEVEEGVIEKKIIIGGSSGGNGATGYKDIYSKYGKIALGGETETMLPSGYKLGSVEFYLNGQLMKVNEFYIEYNPQSGIIRHDPLVEGDWVFVRYIKTGSQEDIYSKYEKISLGGEVETVLPYGYKSGDLEFYLNGQLMRVNEFYFEYNPKDGIIKHDPLVEGDWVFIKYIRR